jgi:hypothetical protein
MKPSSTNSDKLCMQGCYQSQYIHVLSTANQNMHYNDSLDEELL